jgi:hypothetical protein
VCTPVTPVTPFVPDSQDEETLRMYWTAQWERNGQLEEQRLQVSNFVIASSMIGLGLFVSSGALKLTVALTACLAIGLSNVMAIVYSWRSAQWARVHKKRARLLLEDKWPYLHEIQQRAYQVSASPLSRRGVSEYSRSGSLSSVLVDADGWGW